MRRRDAHPLLTDRDRLQRRNDQLQGPLDAARRAGSRAVRQTRSPPGPGTAAMYGRHGSRFVPRRIDEAQVAALPAGVSWPRERRTHGAHVVSQYQEDLPAVLPVIRKFRVHIGSEAATRVVVLHEGFSLPLGHVVTLLGGRFASACPAARATTTYEALCAEVRCRPVVSPDETA